MNVGIEYLKVVRQRLRGLKELGDQTFEQLFEDDIHWAFNETSNSIS